ncbi:ABC transporter substrate-binding protein [bacterium Scap17]|nr:ABC transporter substrate-binding protein [bacterium Scap17]
MKTHKGLQCVQGLAGKVVALIMACAMAQPILAAPLVVRDDAGEVVTLSQPAQRVVTLAPHAAELVAAAGGLPVLIGVSQGSDFPPAVRELPRLASYHGPDLEALLSARPDLIVAWGSGLSDEMHERLATLGMSVFVSEPRTLGDVLTNIARLGALLGTQDIADKRVAALQTRIDQLESEAHVQGIAPLPVFFQLGESPTTTLGGNHLVNELIRRCGGEPLLTDSPAVVPQITREALWLASPQLILHPVAQGQARRDWVAAWRADAGPLSRVALAGLNPDLISRPGPRSVEAMAEVCAAIAKVQAAQ